MRMFNGIIIDEYHKNWISQRHKYKNWEVYLLEVAVVEEGEKYCIFPMNVTPCRSRVSTSNGIQQWYILWEREYLSNSHLMSLGSSSSYSLYNIWTKHVHPKTFRGKEKTSLFRERWYKEIKNCHLECKKLGYSNNEHLI